jgi:hypothetical protein
MKSAIHEFEVASKKDFRGWDCQEMYPKPTRIDLGKPKWLGAVTTAAKKGFEVYN